MSRGNPFPRNRPTLRDTAAREEDLYGVREGLRTRSIEALQRRRPADMMDQPFGGKERREVSVEALSKNGFECQASTAPPKTRYAVQSIVQSRKDTDNCSIRPSKPEKKRCATSPSTLARSTQPRTVCSASSSN